MKVRQVSADQKEVISANNNLRNYLEALSRGREATPHSWLYEDEASDVTLERWLKILKPTLLKYPNGNDFLQFDLKQVKKFGPQGEVPPLTDPKAQEVLEPLFESSKYDSPDALGEWLPYVEKFAKFLFGAKFGTMTPKSFELVVDDMRERDTLTTNSGFPRFTRRETVRAEEIHDAKTGKAYDYPAIVLFRQYNGKLRPVWMYPMSMNLIEGSFTQVIQATLRSSPQSWVREYTAPWVGFEDVKKTLTRMWKPPYPIAGGDTTKMDAHMRKAQITLVFEICKWLFKKQYWASLHKCILRVNEIPLLCSTSQEMYGDHGLASGSGWTQLSETVLQMFMAWLRRQKGMGIGDDFTWIPGMKSDDLVAWLARFGLPAQEEKQNVGMIEVDFLQRMFRQGFFSREDRHVLGAYYPTIRALNSSLNPEKYHKPKDWNSDMFCARQYMILENTVDDPCFPEFVKFVVHGHRDLIPFARKTKRELAEIQRKARLVPGLNPSYNQEKREKPLYSFASIKLAKLMK